MKDKPFKLNNEHRPEYESTRNKRKGKHVSFEELFSPKHCHKHNSTMCECVK